MRFLEKIFNYMDKYFNIHRRILIMLLVSMISQIGISIYIIKQDEFYIREEVDEDLEKTLSIIDNMIKIGKDVKYVTDFINYNFHSKDGYFFASDFNATILAHPLNKDMIGKNFYNSTDIKGYYFFKDMVETVKDGNGHFFNYYWNVPNTNLVGLKRSFVKGYPSLNLVVGTGIYTRELENQIYNNYLDLCIFILMFILSNMLISYFIGIKIVSNINELSHAIAHIKINKYDFEVPFLTNKYEIGLLANMIEQTRVASRDNDLLIYNTVNDFCTEILTDVDTLTNALVVHKSNINTHIQLMKSKINK